MGVHPHGGPSGPTLAAEKLMPCSAFVQQIAVVLWYSARNHVRVEHGTSLTNKMLYSQMCTDEIVSMERVAGIEPAP